MGVAYTAPFSSWSYGMYLASVLPLLLITLLFFITFLYSNHEKQVKQLTFATPVNLHKYYLIKCAAMATGYAIISISTILLSFIFYGMVFQFYGFGSFIIPILLTIFPSMFFVFGAGLLVGSVKPNLLYVLMLAVLIFNSLSLPAFFDLYGSHLFGTYPLTLPVGSDGEPVFALPLSFILGKVMFSALGVLMMLFSVRGFSNL